VKVWGSMTFSCRFAFCSSESIPFFVANPRHAGCSWKGRAGYPFYLSQLEKLGAPRVACLASPDKSSSLRVSWVLVATVLKGELACRILLP
jgi:hypothetical protein